MIVIMMSERKKPNALNKSTFTTILIAMVAALVAPVHGAAISGTLDGDATLTPTGTPGVYAQNFTGDGDDTTYGSFTPSATSTIDFSNPPKITTSGGSILETFAGGTLFGTSSGDGTANGNGTATATIDFVITGGTGIFAGDTGEATITGTITQTSPTTESFTGSYVGTLQAVPDEPATMALLLPTTLMLPIFLGRRFKSQN